MCFNAKSSSYYFHVKTEILADFQIYISVTLIKSVIFIEISMKSNCKSFLWKCLPITTEIFSDYYEKINQIHTERPSCLRELAKEVVPAMTFSLTLWLGL